MLKNPTCKDVNARFTTVPLRALSNHVLIRHINVYNLKNRLFSMAVSLQKCIEHFHIQELSELNTFKPLKTTTSSTHGYWSDKGFKNTVVNRALTSLHLESFEITLKVPLRAK